MLRPSQTINSFSGRRAASTARPLIRGLACAVCWVILVARAIAGGGPENVFVVINPKAPSSMEVANHFVDLRHIPPCNVFYAPWPASQARGAAADFRDKILKPILKEIDRRGLRDQIDQIIYSCDFPYLLDFSKVLGRPDAQAPNRPMLSLTGATYLYELTLAGDQALTDLDTNWYCAPAGPGPNGAGPSVSRAFHGADHWSRGGAKVAAGGRKYLMATALGITASGGNTVPEMLAYLKRAVSADGDRPRGTFYYMQNADIRSQVRQGGFAAAATELTALGLHAEILKGIEPAGKTDVLGITTGATNVYLQKAGVRLLPGALVDNFTSQSGAFYADNGPKPQTRFSEYLRVGAAGSSGSVVEPFAIAAKFPSPELHVHYARGSSMAEAYYQSVAGPFQLLIAGDGLCQPWATFPQVSVNGVSESGLVSDKVDVEATAKYADGRNASRFELFVDGVRVQSTAAGSRLTLDPSKLDDGYHEVRVIAIDDTPIETAGRWVGGVTVKNGHDAVQLSAEGPPRPMADTISVKVATTADGPIAIFHNDREVARIPGKQGEIQIKADDLGKGPVTLQARTVGKTSLRSRPLRVEIQ